MSLKLSRSQNSAYDWFSSVEIPKVRIHFHLRTCVAGEVKINCSLKRQSRYVEYLVIMYSTCIRKISNMPNVKLV